MTTREIKTATTMLAKVGRVVTGTMADTRGTRSTTVITTDGDGISQPFGTPRIFGTLESIREYCDDRREVPCE